jgi:class 3 adenylate cyclase
MPREKPALRSLPSGVITAMFTDIVDSTRVKGLMEGETSGRRDSNFRENIKEPHDRIVLASAHQAGGYVVNPTGDGYCITFVDAEEAVLCALRIQRHLQENPIKTPLGDLQIRIGLHTGIAGPTGEDYIASTVDKTARVQGKAGGGQVFVSHQTQVLVADKTQNVQFEPRGIFDLKGLNSEELYQAVPLPGLKLAPIDFSATESSAHALNSGESQSPSVGGKKGTRLPLYLIAACIAAVAIMAFWKYPQPIVVTMPPSQVLPVGSQWDGSFHFLPPMSSYDGSVDIHVLSRSGDNFSGIYSSENKSYQWLIEGSVKGNKLRWEYVKSVKNPGTEDAVGKAYGEATVDGDKMKGFFRMKTDVKEVASLDLRQNDLKAADIAK